MSTSRMVLHCGANRASLADVAAIETPLPTETHYPIPHTALLDNARNAIGVLGFNVVQEEYGLWNEGQRMFALWQIRNGVGHDEYGVAVGIRNSHDKFVAAGIAGGSRVFVCDNLALSGDIVVFRKHTRFIFRDLPTLIERAFGGLKEFVGRQEARFESYRRTELSDTMVHDLMIRAVDAGAIANSYIPKVLGEWREPQHEEFAPRNVWSLQNSFTEVWKGTNPFDLQSRTERLHGLLDAVAVQEGNDPNEILIEAPSEN